MKKLIKSTLLACLMIISTCVFAQANSFAYNGKTIEVDSRVTAHFGQDYIETLKSRNSNLLLYLNYYAANAFHIEDLGEKMSASEISTFNLIKSSKSKAQDYNPANPENFNVLAYAPSLKEKQQVFKTGKNNLAIILKSKKSFLKAYNEYRESLK